MEIIWGVILACAIVVVGIIEYIKKLDKDKKLKKVYKYLPIPFSFGIGLIPIFINNGFKFWPFILTVLLIFAISTIGHDMIIKFVKEKIYNLKNQK